MKSALKLLGAAQALLGIVIGLIGIGSIAYATTTSEQSVGLDLLIIATLWFGFGILFLGCAAVLSELEINPLHPKRS